MVRLCTHPSPHPSLNRLSASQPHTFSNVFTTIIHPIRWGVCGCCCYCNCEQTTKHRFSTYLICVMWRTARPQEHDRNRCRISLVLEKLEFELLCLLCYVRKWLLLLLFLYNNRACGAPIPYIYEYKYTLIHVVRVAGLVMACRTTLINETTLDEVQLCFWSLHIDWY